jgi:hypothetical protein
MLHKAKRKFYMHLNNLSIEESSTHNFEKNTPPLKLRKIRDIGDWLIWNSLAIETKSKDLSGKNIEIEILSIVKKQFQAPEHTLVVMSQLLARIIRLQTTLKINEMVLSEVFDCYSGLMDLEKNINKGGRPIDRELMGVAKNCFDRFSNTRGKQPTGAELSNLVEVEMQKLKGGRKLNKWGIPTSRRYLPARTAQEWIPKMKLFFTEDSQQELVKSSFN